MKAEVSILVFILVVGGFAGIYIPTGYVGALGPTYVSGSLFGVNNWILADSPYIVAGDVTVESGATLTIEPGVEVRLDPTFKIIVDGTLVADGTNVDRITFTSNLSVPAKGDWYTIRLRTDNNLINNADIEYASYGVFMTFVGSDNVISNSTFTNCAFDGIYITNSDNNLISNCTSSNNDRFGITIYESYGTRVEDCTIQYNNYFGINLNASTFTEIYDTNISYNDGKGILLYSNSHNTTISGCEVDWNNNKGIDLWGTSDNDIINTTVIGNNGVGIDFGGKTKWQEIENCTVTNNEDTGVDLRGSSYSDIIACDVSRNKGHGGIYSADPVENIDIKGSKVLDNSMGHGIDIKDPRSVLIEDSIISRNSGNGIYLNAYENILYNYIKNCTIAENGLNGIYCYDANLSANGKSYVKYNHIFSNRIYLNHDNGIYFYSYASDRSYMQNNHIYLNNIFSNNQHGIYYYSHYNGDYYFQNNELYSNIINSNIQNGIGLLTDTYDVFIDNNDIYNNTIYSNENNGIYFDTLRGIPYWDCDIHSNNIYSNHIYSNYRHGICFYMSMTSNDYYQHNNIYSNRIYQHTGGISRLNYAVDNSALDIITGGDAVWRVDKSTFYYNGESLRSGNISHRQSTYLDAFVLGPGTIKFYWKIDADGRNDYFSFWIDVNRKDILTSTGGSWRQENFEVPSGFHSLRWIYSKGDDGTVGEDCGWIDKVEFTNPFFHTGIFLHSQEPSDFWGVSEYYNNTIYSNLQGMLLSNMKSQTIYANNISYNNEGILFLQSSSNILRHNNVTYNNLAGINFSYSSSNNILENNNITANNNTGLLITEKSNDNLITRNNITENLGIGLEIIEASGNQIHHNNFINNTQNAYDSTIALNDWDDGSEGNYWSDYLGTDDNGDGFGEDPYVIPGGGSRDWHPFVYEVDVTAPYVVITSPLDGEKNVPIDSTITITFSKEMNITAVESSISISGGLTPTNFVWDIDNKIVTFTPSSNLQSRTEYEVIISTEAKDPMGNRIKIAYVFRFWSEDIEAPKIILTSPFDGQDDVDLNSDVVVIFEESMDPSSVTYSCNPDPFGWTVSWNGNNTEVTFSHTDFNNQATYTFQILTAKDVAGLDLIPGPVPNPWAFTTKDILGPEIVATTPADNSQNVTTTSDIVVSFNEEMDLATVTYSCVPDPLGWSIFWSNMNKTATFSHNEFSERIQYLFQITNARDLAGNDLVIGVVPNPFTFSTTGDYQGPQITLTSPTDTEAFVQLDADVVVTFSEAMDNSSITFTSSPDPGGWTESWSNGDTVVTYSHNPFDGGTTYSFSIDSALDVAGNNLVSGALANPWSFVTIGDITGPHITVTSPVNNAVDVGLDSNITVTFNEAVDPSTLDYICSPDPGGWTQSWGNGNTMVSFSHNSLEIGTLYTFYITALEDFSGNDLDPGPVPNPWSFTSSGDLIAPYISSTSPAHNEIDVGLDSYVIVTFSEPIYPPSLEYICTPNPGGWFENWNNEKTTLTFLHDPFPKGTTYTFQIYNVKDFNGNNMGSGLTPNPWSFTCEGDLIAPQIISTSPADGEINVNLNDLITITFSEAMDTSTVEYTCTPDPGGWFESWSNDNNEFSLLHNPFDLGFTYTFEITSGKDIVGNNLTEGSVPRSWDFSTISLDSLIITPSEIRIPVNGTVVLIAWVYDSQGNPISDIEFNWSINNNLGMIYPQGKQAVTFSASSTEGLCLITVSVGELSADASITIKKDEIEDIEPQDQEPEDLLWLWFLILVILILFLINLWSSLRKQKPEAKAEKQPLDKEDQVIPDEEEGEFEGENSDSNPITEENQEIPEESKLEGPKPPKSD